MDIYLLRSTVTGKWLNTEDGWTDQPVGACVFADTTAELQTHPNLEWVKFCECPL